MDSRWHCRQKIASHSEAFGVAVVDHSLWAVVVVDDSQIDVVRIGGVVVLEVVIALAEKIVLADHVGDACRLEAVHNAVDVDPGRPR